MKTAKRFTSILMALAIVLTLIPALAAPALAADDEIEAAAIEEIAIASDEEIAVADDEIAIAAEEEIAAADEEAVLADEETAVASVTITKNPPTNIGRKKAGEVFTISVDADGQGLSYQWYATYGNTYARRKVGSNSPTLTTSVADREFPLYSTTQLVTYRCEIRAADGSKVTSSASTVEAYMTFWQALLHGILVIPNAIINITRVDLLDTKFYSNIFNMVILPFISPLLSILMVFWLPIQALFN